MGSETMSWGRAALRVVALSVCGLVVAPSDASAACRVALVVGNSAYAAIGTLPNPGNDAADGGTNACVGSAAAL